MPVACDAQKNKDETGVRTEDRLRVTGHGAQGQRLGDTRGGTGLAEAGGGWRMGS